MPAFSTLIEDFSDGELPVGWDQWGTGSPSYSYANGRFTLTTTGNNFGGVVTESTYDITGDGVFVEMPVKVSVTGGTQVTEWGFEVRDSGNDRYAFLMDYNGGTDVGTIRGVRQNSSFTTLETIFSGLTFDYSQHRWFRIREASGSVFFDTAPDASGAPGTWTQRGTASWNAAVDKTALFAASRSFTATGAGTGVATYDNINGGVFPSFTPGACGDNILTANLQPSNSSDVHFRAWVTFIRNAFCDGGWVQTTDKKQMDHTTVTRPTAANEKRGRMIFRMADSLQASKPVYLRIDFGSGAAANSPGVWLTLGTGSDGNGAITGAVFTSGATSHIYTSSNTTTETTVSHASTSTSHCAVALFVTGNANYILTFSIERGRTTAGAEDGDYVVLQYSAGPSNTLNRFNYLVRAGGTQVTEQASAAAVTSPHRPAHTRENVSYGNIIPLKPSGGFAIPAPPCLGYIVMEDDEWTTAAEVAVYKYGTPVIYRRMQTVRHSQPSGNGTGNHSVWIRFDGN